MSVELGRIPTIRHYDCDAPFPSWDVMPSGDLYVRKDYHRLFIIPIFCAAVEISIFAEDLVENIHSLRGQTRLAHQPAEASRILQDILDRQNQLIVRLEESTGLKFPICPTVSPSPPPNILACSMVRFPSLLRSNTNAK